MTCDTASGESASLAVRTASYASTALAINTTSCVSINLTLNKTSPTPTKPTSTMPSKPFTNLEATTTSTMSTYLASKTPTKGKPQIKGFFSFAPEIRNKIYGYVAESKTGKGNSLNNIKIPGLFFACWATLREGLGMLLNLNYISRLTLYNTETRHLFNQHSTHTYHAMRPGTKALLQAAGDSARIQTFTSYICVGDIPAAHAPVNGSHVIYSLVVEIDKEGMAKVYFRDHIPRDREEDMTGITETVKKALDMRLKKREAKAFEFDDFELVLSTVKTYSACWCPSKTCL